MEYPIYSMYLPDAPPVIRIILPVRGISIDSMLFLLYRRIWHIKVLDHGEDIITWYRVV